MSKDRLDRKEAAAFLGAKPQTLAAWASSQRYRLPFIKIGRKVQYRISDLEKFLESRTVDCGAGEIS